MERLSGMSPAGSGSSSCYAGREAGGGQVDEEARSEDICAVTPVKARCVEYYQVHRLDEVIRFFVGGFETEIDHYETWIDPRKNEVVFRLRIPE